MKVKLSIPDEWGYYIDPLNFELLELKGDIPLKSLVILRKREYLKELSRVAIETQYGTISKGGLTYLTKIEFVRLLCKSCYAYIVEHESLPPHVTISPRNKETNRVELLYNFKKNEIFQLKITEEMLEVKDFAKILKKIEDVSEKIGKEQSQYNSWKVEYSPNGRLICKKCKRQIKQKEIRFVDLQTEDDTINQKLYHLGCVDWKEIRGNKLFGLDKLDENDMKNLQKKLK